MRLIPAAAALAACCASSARAFSDTSPFVLFSTAKVDTPAGWDQIQSGTEIRAAARRLLASCPTDRYLVVSQPNLNAGHLYAAAASKPDTSLRAALGRARSRYAVAEVAGGAPDAAEIEAYIREACEAARPSVEVLDLEPLPATGSVARTMKQNDDQLGLLLDQLEAQGSYTVIYAAGRPQTQTQTQAHPATPYTAEFPDAVHAELRRALPHAVRQGAREAEPNLPLFQKYQYFSPGIFTALITVTVLVSILYAGISAVASLEVPYGAFDKEMGPAAQRKQQ
ncbi:ER protein BIG1 [Durotheca rogersii]|uniref:ER protein BIG1 n=1 Tax=Durotheca rogersii TaxID=419775 RepID=UPI00221F23F5|nr:ER protein BIG1 [Durotheca rogersii]KAI5862823.1 ER protein BIG1 [Durotheca rogersii]